MKIIIILIGVSGGVNLGLINRLGSNFDVDEIRLIDHKLNKKEWEIAKMFSANSREQIDQINEYKNLENALSDIDLSLATSANVSFKDSQILRKAILLNDLNEKIDKKISKLAIVFGREDNGLTSEEIGLCDGLLTIKTSSTYETLNIANSVAIILHELYIIKNKNQRVKVASKDIRSRTIMEYDRLVSKTINHPIKRKTAVKAFSNILNRSLPNHREASILLGIIRKTVNRIDKINTMDNQRNYIEKNRESENEST